MSFLELKELEKITKCTRPCQYNVYKLVEDKMESFIENATALHLGLGSKNVLKRREILIYTFTSFIAEFGGALGLFVGFSFLMLWNYMEQAIKILMHKFNIYGKEK